MSKFDHMRDTYYSYDPLESPLPSPTATYSDSNIEGLRNTFNDELNLPFLFENTSQNLDQRTVSEPRDPRIDFIISDMAPYSLQPRPNQRAFRTDRDLNLSSTMATSKFNVVHQCLSCNASFGRAYDLKRHGDVHAQFKMFRCQFCNRAFSRKDALNRHEKNVVSGLKQRCSERAKSERVEFDQATFKNQSLFKQPNQMH